MDNNTLLSKVLNLDSWQEVQNAISARTKLAIVTVDYRGAPITKHSNCSQFCAAIRGDKKLSQYCEKCDSRGGLEAVRQNKPYTYLCHFDIVDIAIPIIVNNNYVGAVLAGQVRLKDEYSLERILTAPQDVTEKLQGELQKAYSKLPKLSADDIAVSADMLDKICKYAVQEALSKNLIIDMYERLYKVDGMKTGGDTLQAIEQMKAELNNALTKTHINRPQGGQIKHAVLKPAVEYLRAHPADNIKIAEMANLCNLSQGYFSRTFTQETGMSFTVYLTMMKVNSAQAMLSGTDMTVAEISDSLGFSDPSYFNRVFKKVKGITPAAYRNSN